MNGPEIIASVVTDIERQLREHNPRQPAKILVSMSPWVATALLQKAIRRGRTEEALTASAALLSTAPDRLWRRLAVIAVEDVGLGDLEAVFMTVAAAMRRRRLAQVYGHWRLVSFIVSRLSEARKCRAADDLYVVTGDCPEWQPDRDELVEKPFGNLMNVVASADPLERRAIAVRYAMTSRCNSQAVFDFLCEAAHPHTLVEIAREAYRQTGELICGFLPLLWAVFAGRDVSAKSDAFPPEIMLGGIPSWALDKFTREGRAAIARFLARETATSNWLDSRVASRDRKAAFGHALFRVEGGLIKDRVLWAEAVRLRRQADWNSFPTLEPMEAVELLHLVRSDVRFLNEERAHVL